MEHAIAANIDFSVVIGAVLLWRFPAPLGTRCLDTTSALAESAPEVPHGAACPAGRGRQSSRRPTRAPRRAVFNFAAPTTGN